VSIDGEVGGASFAENRIFRALSVRAGIEARIRSMTESVNSKIKPYVYIFRRSNFFAFFRPGGGAGADGAPFCANRISIAFCKKKLQLLDGFGGKLSG
jgi:hypothetical protein